MGILMDRIMSNIHPEDDRAKEKVRMALKPLKEYCAWIGGVWGKLNGISWNSLENTPSHVKLLSNMLIRIYTGVGTK